MKNKLLFIVIFIFWQTLLFSGRVIDIENGISEIEKITIENNITTLNLSTLYGNIHIISSDSFFIEIEKKITGVDSDSALFLLDYLNFDTEVIENSLELTFSSIDSTGIIDGIHYNVNYICQVPKNMILITDVGSGNVDIYDIFSPVNISIGNGNIKMAGGNSSININFLNSNIDIRWSIAADHKISIEGDNGNISLLLPLSCSAKIKSLISSGNFTIENFQQEDIQRLDDDIIQINSGLSEIILSVKTGNIFLKGY